MRQAASDMNLLVDLVTVMNNQCHRRASPMFRNWIELLEREYNWTRRKDLRRPRRDTFRNTKMRRLRIEALEDRRLLTTLTVNSALDNLSSGDGLVTLREAIIAANTDGTTDLGHTGGGPDTIVFDSSLNGTPITLSIAGNDDTSAAGDLDITSDITIQGNGPANTIIQAGTNTTNGISRVFEITSGNTAEISGVTIRHGRATVDFGTAGAFDGGGIFNNGTLTVNNSTISQNIADRQGGGIENDGTLVVTDSTISQNSANNGDGGAIHIQNGDVTVAGSTLSQNFASDQGGGILAFGATLTITNSTISQNSANFDGGGVNNYRGTTVVTNSTLTGNRADADGVGGGTGGGLWTNSFNPTSTLFNTIVAGNFQGTGSTANDIANKDVEAASANNLVGDAGSAGGLTHDNDGNPAAGGNNIVGNAGSGTLDITTVLDTTLQNNGGSTDTHALVTGSPAIDAGSNDRATEDGTVGGTALTTDQRGAGFARIIDGGIAATVDIGAFEFDDPQADLVITKTDSFDPLTGVLIYTVTVDNAGPSDAAGVVVTDTLPADVTFVSTTGCAEDPAGVPTCTLGTIVAGGSAAYTIEVTVDPTAPVVVTNMASVTSSPSDPDSSNNSVSLDTTVKPKDPGFSYVDADNDNRFFLADGDVPLDDGEVTDGIFNTDVTEGPDYTVAIPGAGLVINGAAIVVPGDIRYSADGDLVINTDLTAGDDIDLTSRDGSVLLDDPTIMAPDEIEIEAELDILSTDDMIVATGPRSEVELKAGRDILLFGTSVTAVREVELKAGQNITVNDSLTPLGGSLTASDPARGEVELRAGLDIDVSGAEIDAGDEIQLIAGRDLIAVDAIMTALGNSRSEIELRAVGDITATGAELFASDEVELRSDGGSISADSATMEALVNSNGEVQLIAARDINVASAMLNASRDVELRARGGRILASGATMNALGNSRGEVELRADAGDIDVDGARLAADDEVQLIADGSILATGTVMEATGNSRAEIELRAGSDITLVGAALLANDEIDVRSSGGSIDATDALMEALGNSRAEIELRAAGDIVVNDATLSTSDKIEVRSAGGSIDATDSTFAADEVELRAAIDIILTGWTVITSDLELRAGGSIIGP
jgi:uncharacterized repeat protein (TIGR01451 family)